MRDKNFFEVYTGKGSSFDKTQMIKYALAAVALPFIIYTSFNLIQIPVLKREISEITKDSNRKDFIERREAAKQKKEILVELEQMNHELEYVSLEINERDNIGSYLVESIINAMSNEIFLQSVNIKENTITIKGVSKNKEDIAKLQSNLRQIVYFDNIFIPSIQTENDFFTFDINLNFIDEIVDNDKEDLEAINIEEANIGKGNDKDEIK